MKINIKTTNLNLTPLIRKTVEEKISSLEKFISYEGSLIEAFVEIACRTRHHKKGEIYYAEANIEVPGNLFRAEAKREDLYQAVTEVKDELQGLLKKHKEKIITKRKKAAGAVKRKYLQK